MNLNKEIGTRAKKYRKKFGYSQQNMADMLDLSRASYVNMEGGRQSWASIYLYTLCRVFKCKPTNLFPKIAPVKVKSKIVKRRVVVLSKKVKLYSKIQ